MATNYPGPYDIRIGYTVGALTTPLMQHVQKLNVDLVETAQQGDAFANYDIKDINGDTTVSLQTLVEDYLALMVALYHTSMTVDFVELWKYPVAQSSDSVFWSAYTPTVNAGTSGTQSQAAGEDIYVFRSQEGGIMKVALMEDITVPASPSGYAALSTAEQALVDFILDGDGVNYSAPFLARDTSYPFAFKQQFPGRNEGLWKVRNGR